MKIDIRRIAPEGLTLTEEFSPEALDLDTEIIKVCSPVSVKAEVSRISNAISVHLSSYALMCAYCSRCLEEFKFGLNKKMVLNYAADNASPEIDLDPDIREEIMLDYPLKPLCKAECKGLCPKCGKNFNTETCDCKTK